MKIEVKCLLQELILISEKSAEISRLFKTYNEKLFDILIQEKSDETKNSRFIHDFKTFADVLIQEMAKYRLESKFPTISERIYGEESNLFENKLGESITVQIQADKENTYDMLVNIMDGNIETANSLLEIIYSSKVPKYLPHQLSDLSLVIDQKDIALWIDPIDSTSEYINGEWPQSIDCSWIKPHGLQCVTCLFGVFDIHSGIPIIGVLAQPFYKQVSDDDRPDCVGRCVWGFNIDGVCGNNVSVPTNKSMPERSKLILIGAKENEDIKRKLSSLSPTMYIAGAGYKLLTVALGEANILVTSSKSTFFWDTCAGHAILRSLGGGIVPFEGIEEINQDNIDRCQIKYSVKGDNLSYSNSKGLIAYTCKHTLLNVIKILK